MKKDDWAILSSYMEGHQRLSHQRIRSDHKKETNAKTYLPPKSRELLQLEILNFTYKTNYMSTQFEDKYHNHNQYEALVKEINNELYLSNPCLFFGKGNDLVINQREN